MTDKLREAAGALVKAAEKMVRPGWREEEDGNWRGLIQATAELEAALAPKEK